MNRDWKTVTMAMAALLCAHTLLAAGHEKSMADAMGRKKAAENRLLQIKTTSPQLVTEAEPLYSDAAARNNAWVTRLCDALEQGAAAAPDVSARADSAALSLVAWVGVVNKATKADPMTDSVAQGTKNLIAQGISDIAAQSWRAHHGASPEKRRKAAADLRERLLWKAFDEVR